jgi:hypothetical protein
VVEVRLSDEAFLAGVDQSWCGVIAQYARGDWDLITVDVRREDDRPLIDLYLGFKRRRAIAVIRVAMAALQRSDPAVTMALAESDAERLVDAILRTDPYEQGIARQT